MQWYLLNVDAPYLLKVDDDVFLRVAKIVADLTSRDSTAPLYWGRVHPHSSPDRNPRSPSYIAYDQFAAPVYPPFVAGSAYVLTRDNVELLVGMAVNHRGEIYICRSLLLSRDEARNHARRRSDSHPSSLPNIHNQSQ